MIPKDTKNKYDDFMDKEVIPLCDKLNSLNGIKTMSSCSGHGKKGVTIRFKSTYEPCLFLLTWSIDKRYCQVGHNWEITTEISDISYDNNLPLHFILESKTKGEIAYKEMEEIIKSINRYLSHGAFIKKFKLNNLLVKINKYENKIFKK